MRAESLLSFETIFGFLFTLARISGVFAFLPLAAFKAGPETARIVFTLAITLMLRSSWPMLDVAHLSTGVLVAGVMQEAALGLVIGVAISIVFEVFQLAAQAVSLQAGLGYASTVDPTSGADSPVLLTIAQLTAGLFFFTLGVDRVLVKALAESLRICPPGSFHLNRAAAEALTQFAATIFSSGLRLAAPLLTLLLLADASLAVLGRIQAQLQLVSVTLPVKLALTMWLLAATLVLQKGFFESLATSCMKLIEGILRGAH